MTNTGKLTQEEIQFLKYILKIIELQMAYYEQKERELK